MLLEELPNFRLFNVETKKAKPEIVECALYAGDSELMFLDVKEQIPTSTQVVSVRGVDYITRLYR